MTDAGRGAVAGALAAVAWRAVEPGLRRLFGHPYSDPGLLTGFVARGRARSALDYAVQACGGALFGSLFAAFGGRGVRQAVPAALVENAVLWPAVGLLERHHPDVHAGRWPGVFANPRAIGISFAGHALFGMLLGLLGPRARAEP